MFIHHYIMESYSKFEMTVHFTTYISLYLAPVLDVDQIIFSGWYGYGISPIIGYLIAITAIQK